MRLHLEALARHKGQGYDELCQQLKKIHLSVLQLETKQWQLKQQLQPMLLEIKLMYRDFHTSACNGLSQIRSHFVSGHGIQGRHYLPTMIDESLPDRFFLTSVEHVEHRMQQCIQNVQYFEQQLAARIRVVESSRQLVSSGYYSLQSSASSSQQQQLYGQTQRVTPAMLLSIIKQQAHNFVLLSAQVNAVHQAVHDLKQGFLHHRRQVQKDTSNPFETADRREAAEKKQNEEKIRLEQQIQAQQSLQKQQQNQPQLLQQPQVTAQFAAPAAGTATMFGQPAAATGAATGAAGNAFGLNSFTVKPTGATAAGSAGAFGSNTGALSFGANMTTSNKTAGTSFGLTSTTAALDLATKPGTTTSTAPAFGAPAFGAPAATTATAAPTFGMPASGAATTAPAFGAPAASGAPSTFGALTVTSSPGGKRTAESFGINPINTTTTGPFGSFGGDSLSVGTGKRQK
jgi:hypothetical protein